MNLRHLQSFVVLAEELNFSRAAERLHVAQPALSQQIRALEARLDTQLIDRGSRPLRLTEAGTYFASEARQLLDDFEHASLGTRQIGLGRRGWLGIGFTRSAMYSVLPPALKAFHRAYPGVELKLFELLTEEQADALRDKRIHVGIGRQVQPIPGCTTHALLSEPLMAVLQGDHPLAARADVALAELAASPLVLYPQQPSASFPRLIESLYRDAGLAPDVAHRADEIQTAIALVAAGLGVTYVGASVARLGRPDVVYKPLRGVGAGQQTTLSATWRGDDQSAHLHAFLSALAIPSHDLAS